jgi:hypothetical protein
VDAAGLVITTVLAVIGLYLAHSLRRQTSLKIAEQRIASYGELWKLMGVVRPTRLTKAEMSGVLATDDARSEVGPLTRGEASSLYRAMTRWYFDAGNGMLLTDTTKWLYLEAKHRLGEFAAGDNPEWEREGTRRISELSLLRLQMRSDLDIYGVSYFGEPGGDDDRAFLDAAGIDPTKWGRPPWHRRFGKHARRQARTISERGLHSSP